MAPIAGAMAWHVAQATELVAELLVEPHGGAIR
jgi:hypothetical protein